MNRHTQTLKLDSLEVTTGHTWGFLPLYLFQPLELLVFSDVATTLTQKDLEGECQEISRETQTHLALPPCEM